MGRGSWSSFRSRQRRRFGIAPVLRSLTRSDFNRPLEVVRSFKRDSPRAIGILAIASEKPLARNLQPVP